VRDGVGHVAHAADELLDLVQHPVHRLSEKIQLVGIATHRQTARQVAIDDGARRLAQPMNFREERSPNEPAAQHAGKAQDRDGAEKSVQEQRFQRPKARVVAANQKVVAAGQGGAHEERANRTIAFGDGELVDTRRVGRLARPRCEIAGERLQVRVGEQDDAVGDVLAPYAGRDHRREHVGTLAAEQVGKSLHVLAQELCAHLLDVLAPGVPERGREKP
jgi:hypothetical protein